jgi:predicted aldo/keto reductase-like oxidoreductase
MRKAVRGKRDRFYIGFGDWPVKITEEYENQLTKDLLLGEIDKRLKAYGTDMLDIWRPVGATWGPGQTSIATLLNVNRKALDVVVAAFETARKQGKVRFLGISAHNPKVFRFVLTEYPQFSVVIFPYLFLTEELGGDSLLALAKRRNVGVVGLKPFGAGTTFGIKPTQISGRIDDRARVLIKEMLKEPRISAVVPGVNIPEQLEVNVRGSYERDRPTTPKEKATLAQCARNFHANLTPEYEWLRKWVTV